MDSAKKSVRYDAANLLLRTFRRENERLASILKFCRTAELEAAVKAKQELLTRVFQSLAAEFPVGAARVGPDGHADMRMPVRTTRGPLDFGLPESKLSEQDRQWYQSTEFTLDGDERFELVNFIDGQRTIAEIRDLLSGEFGPIPMQVVSHYIDDLVKADVVRWARMTSPNKGDRTE